MAILGAAALVVTASAHAQRTATAVPTIVNGFLVAITVTDGGSGYSTAPAVTVSGGGGSSASAVATLAGSAVGQIIVVNAGRGYTNAPNVLVDPPATPWILEQRMVPEITISGPLGGVGIVEWSESVGPLAQWHSLTNVNLQSGRAIVVDTSANGGERFYRSRSLDEPPGVRPANFVWIPPGSFLMGSPEAELGRDGDEGPQTRVAITKGFWLSKYEVTQAEYSSLVGTNPAVFLGDLECPVESVSWYEATNYCSKLTARELGLGRLPRGYRYSLPTEAQWEYACRSGTTTATSLGSTLNSTQANFRGTMPYNGAAIGPFVGRTSRVGAYAPNAWGLYDVHGNVGEWCLDGATGSYSGTEETDPVGPRTGPGVRSVRGGAWFNYGEQCRSATRFRNWAEGRNDAIGFRVALLTDL